MIYEFNSIYNDELLDSLVLFITGSYSFFNNIVIDRVRDKYCRIVNLGNVFGWEFGKADMVNVEEFEDFIGNSNIPSISGKRVCIINFRELTKKQLEYLNKYINNPGSQGLLLVIIEEYRDFIRYLQNNIIRNDKRINLLKLSFPNRDILRKILREKLGKLNIAHGAIDLFISKVGSQYDMYDEIVEMVYEYGQENVSYKDMGRVLKGIDNYDFEDFVNILLENNKGVKKTYKMMYNIVRDIGARNLVLRLRMKFDLLLQMRLLINKGVIPVGIKYSIKDVKDKLNDNNKLRDVSNYVFRSLQIQASKTYLVDLLSIRMILNGVGNDIWGEEVYENLLLRTVNRKERIGDIGNDIEVFKTCEVVY